jgi:hypothetical protein
MDPLHDAKSHSAVVQQHGAKGHGALLYNGAWRDIFLGDFG